MRRLILLAASPCHGHRGPGWCLRCGYDYVPQADQRSPYDRYGRPW